MLLGVWLNGRRPQTPTDPLVIDPSELVSISLDGTALVPGSPAYTVAAALPKRLSGIRPAGGAVAWNEPATLRLSLRDGSTLWLQIMREGVDDLVRVNADAPAAAPPPAKSRAAAIRALRLRAYRLPAESLSPILGEVTGEDRQFAGRRETHKLIHKNKAGKVN